MDLLAGGDLGLVGLLEAAPHQGGADVGVADIGHPRCTPEGHRRRSRRHRRLGFLSSARAAAADGDGDGEMCEDAGERAKDAPRPHDKMKKRTSQSLNVEYEKKRVEDEKAKKERDAIIQAKKEEREKSEAKRKELREKMFRRTRSGQPVMKYRIEHLLETAIGSSSK